MNKFIPRRRYESADGRNSLGPLTSVAAWRAAKADPSYTEEAARQARSAANADVEDRVMEWISAVATEAWDDL